MVRVANTLVGVRHLRDRKKGQQDQTRHRDDRIGTRLVAAFAVGARLNLSEHGES
jgi:hypothetical protein